MHELLIAQVDKVLIGLGIRGILTMLGVRKTVASGDMILTDKGVLISSFCKPIVAMTEDEKMKRKKVEKLIVGARALTKHAHRSSEGFWGSGTGSEADRNQQAKTALNRILTNCIWINIHSLPHNEYMIEVKYHKTNSAELKKVMELGGQLMEYLEGWWSQ